MSRGKALPPPDTSVAASVLSRRFSMDDDEPRQTRRQADESPTPTISTDRVAPNPLNTRVISAESPRVLKMRASLEEHGQIEAVTVVTRPAFAKTFPEFEAAVGPVDYVEVSGGQRLMACFLLGREIKYTVDDDLAASRSRFLAATAEENLGRDDLDAIELAEMVSQLVKENGNNQSETGRQIGRTSQWVNQKIALLKLVPAAHELIRAHSLPESSLRGQLWKLPEQLQIAAIEKVIASRSPVTVVTGGEEMVPRQRPQASRLATTVRKLAKNPAEALSETLRSELPPDYYRALVADVLRRDRALVEELLNDGASTI